MTPGGLGVPDGVPDAGDLELDMQWSTLFTDQLAAVRKSAENWRTGLAGLLGLVSIFSVVEAPRATGDLKPWAAWSVGLCLVCSAVFAVLGAVAALRAAYGVPQQMTRAEFRRIGGKPGLDLQQASKSRSDLLRAKVLTYVALALLGVTFALAWYGPAKDTNLVKVTTSELAVCGSLARSGDGELQVDSATAGPVVIKLSAVATLEVVESCDE
jgi:hypothetical protein